MKGAKQAGSKIAKRAEPIVKKAAEKTDVAVDTAKELKNKAVKVLKGVGKKADAKAEKVVEKLKDSKVLGAKEPKSVAGVMNKSKRTVEVNGKTVIIDSKTFDPKLVDKQGRTNIQRMEQGLAPIGTDGKSVNMHHIDQTNEGPVMEITATEHQKNYSNLHIYRAAAIPNR